MLPILLLLLVAVIDVGRAFRYSLLLNDAAFQGARLAGDPAATLQAVRGAVRADLPSDVVVADGDIGVTPQVRREGETVKVAVAWPYVPIMPGSAWLFPTGVRLQAEGATVVR